MSTLSGNSKLPPIKYTSKDFASIKQELITYAKTYYPDTYKDFNDASFGSLLLDMTAYVGDVLSFYLDYQANETYLDTAIETKNLLKLAKQLGFKNKMAASSAGKVAVYIQIPADTAGEPDTTLIPTLKQGSTLTSESGASFILAADVDFSRPEIEKIVAAVDDNGVPTSFAFKGYGDVISGLIETEILTVSSYQKFLKLKLSGENISEVLSVVDSEGNEYYEVPYLSHNVIFEPVRNNADDFKKAPFFLRQRLVPRRFITDVDEDGNVVLQFGYGSEASIKANEFPDPAAVVLKRYARNYFSDDSFDPNNMLKTDKFGVVPPAGELLISYRRNDSENLNLGVGSLNRINTPVLVFNSEQLPAPSDVTFIEGSIDVENEEPINGQVEDLTPIEIRTRAIDAYAAQNRAVTRQDYLSLVYRMPTKFGNVKRANIVQDKDSLKRNLNLYVVAEDENGFLESASSTTKENLKTWINNYRMINDSVDILNGNIVNYGIEFRVLGKLNKNPQEILNKCLLALQQEYSEQLFFGVPFYISNVFKILNDLPDVIDTQEVKLVRRIGANYSGVDFDIEEAITEDDRFLVIPEDIVLELKFPALDIFGVVV
jgi:hypothetical protein